MRRGGQPRGRGNNNNRSIMHRPQNPRQTQGASMMPDHFQGLKDIDMELELLKRKREIIEQQQEMLSSSYRQKNDYNEPSFDQSRDNRYDDYSRLYEEGPRESFGQSSRKRAHVPVWETDAPKRFSTGGAGRGSVRHSFVPRASERPAPRPYKPRPAPPPKKNFNPSKVTKGPSGTAPRLAAYPPAERRRLVGAALSAGVVRPAPAPANTDDWVLREDREPSRQLTGRLELALGAILKDVKAAHPNSEAVFKSSAASRVMKQTIRERVRVVMLGKTVTSTYDQTKAAYYERFPPSDDEVFVRGLQAYQGSEFITVKSDDPEKYFKQNMSRLMSNKLEEMFNKLQEIYTTQRQKKTKPQKKQRSAAPKTVSTNTESLNQSNTESEIAQPNSEQTPVLDNAETQPEKSAEDDGASKQDVADVSKQAEEEVPKPDAPNPQETSDPEVQVIEELKPVDASIEISDTESEKRFATSHQYQMFDRLMSAKMIHLLKKFTPNIMKIMDIDAMYNKTKATIYNETKRKLTGTARAAPPPSQNVAETSTDNAEARPRRAPLLYFVKIHGKPALPKRKAMETFFQQFQPKSIKKHRTVHSLLFVGFTEKEPFERILAANGTVIGRHTLDIKVSERNFDKPKKPEPNDSIDDDLDKQITGLLNSIRKDEEASDFTKDVTSDNTDDAVPNAKPQEENGQKLVIMTQISDEKNEVVNKEPQSENVAPDNIVDISDVPENGEDQEVIEIKDVLRNTEEKEANGVDAIKMEQNDMVVELKNANETEQNDTVADLKNEVKGTPTRTSARLAAPGSIRTRRMSKLAE